jgi:HAD superfamily hydrolase (TIGR01549 family)
MQTPNNELRYDMVILDVGGTLLGFRDPVPFQEFLVYARLPATDDDAHAFHRRFVHVIVADRDAAKGLGVDNAALDGWWRAIFAKTWPDRPDLAEEMFRWFREDRFDRAFPEVVPTLEALRELGISLGILSNFPTSLENLLRRLGLRDYFEFVIASAAVGMAKPDARIFDLAVSRADRPRNRLLYVGDHLGDDIEGAHGAGLDAVLIDRGDHHPEALCPRIRSLAELVSYVQPPAGPARAIIFDMHRGFTPTLAHGFLPLGILPLGILPLGILPLLYDLRGRGYRLGLVAGDDPGGVAASLAPGGVVSLFDAVVTADEIAEGLPDPEPFRAAAAQLGRPPSECLAVANAPSGIQSAKAAGMSCVALETALLGEELSRAGADRVFCDIPTLRDWLLSR